jgi:hypothetical protein
MKNDDDLLSTSTSRRGFVQRCLGTGAVLAASPPSSPRGMSAEIARRPLATASPDLTEYERLLSRTDRMDVLGRPRSWSVVTQGFHPFSPERIVVTRTGADRSSRFRDSNYGDRCGRLLRRRIDGRIGEMIEDDKRRYPDYDPPGGWLPDAKRESIFWIMDAMTDHYRVRSQFEPWVVGLVGRELLGSTAMGRYGLAHQFQHGDSEIPVDCPPVDWWLFLYPDGLDWSSLDEQEIYAVIAHVGRNRPYASNSCCMLRVWCLTGSLGREVEWAGVARMGRIEAARYLNLITARLLDGLG